MGMPIDPERLTLFAQCFARETRRREKRFEDLIREDIDAKKDLAAAIREARNPTQPDPRRGLKLVPSEPA
jgi:hypothetical protein